MKHGWFIVQFIADAMASPFTHNREAVGFHIALDGNANIINMGIATGRLDATPHGFLSHRQQTLGFIGDLANRQGDAGIAKPAIEDGAHVDSNNIAFFELVAAGDAMADRSAPALLVHQR